MGTKPAKHAKSAAKTPEKSPAIPVQTKSAALEIVRQTPRGNGSQCWIWPGKLNRDGYGVIPVIFQDGSDGEYLVHRLSWELVYGVIPTGKRIRHVKCHNRACWNPLHLAPGTQKENVADMLRDGTQRKSAKELMPLEVRRGELCSIAELLGMDGKRRPQRDVLVLLLERTKSA